MIEQAVNIGRFPALKARGAPLRRLAAAARDQEHAAEDPLVAAAYAALRRELERLADRERAAFPWSRR